ncbi:MAG: endonuclease/exonuclease/phosphatase family protein [Armatimonadota bacterium]
MTGKPAQSKRRRDRRYRAADRIRLACAAVSLSLWAFLTALYALRPAGWDPITIWPFHVWAWPGLVFALASLTGRAKRRSWLVAGMWILAVGLLTEEPRALLRSVAHRGEEAWQAARSEGRALRVVSLNCKSSLAAVEEALAQNADIVLLQERPSLDEFDELVEAGGDWEMAAAFDTAVLVRGELKALPTSPEQKVFVCPARVRPSRLPEQELIVASVHLPQPALRRTLWRRATWQRAERIRRRRAGYMGDLAALAAEHVGATATVFGGDFNTPGGDSLFRPLRAHLRDAFEQAGVGWPDTFLNEAPLSRIDQVWISPQLEATTLRAVRTQNSDHRMVVCEVLVRR